MCIEVVNTREAANISKPTVHPQLTPHWDRGVGEVGEPGKEGTPGSPAHPFVTRSTCCVPRALFRSYFTSPAVLVLLAFLTMLYTEEKKTLVLSPRYFLLIKMLGSFSLFSTVALSLYRTILGQ